MVTALNVLSVYVLLGLVIGATDTVLVFTFGDVQEEFERENGGRQMDVLDKATWFALSSLLWPVIVYRWVRRRSLV